MSESESQPKKQRDFGEQPLCQIMTDLNLKAHALVEASAEQLTHKMVARAAKGRKLTPNVKMKIVRALNKLTEKQYSVRDLFNYK